MIKNQPTNNVYCGIIRFFGGSIFVKFVGSSHPQINYVRSKIKIKWIGVKTRFFKNFTNLLPWISVSTAPTNLEINEVQSRGFKIEFNKPDNVSGILAAYKIAIYKGGTCVQQILIPGMCSNCNVRKYYYYYVANDFLLTPKSST